MPTSAGAAVVGLSGRKHFSSFVERIQPEDENGGKNLVRYIYTHTYTEKI